MTGLYTLIGCYVVYKHVKERPEPVSGFGELFLLFLLWPVLAISFFVK